jgi:hypothetical protein
LKQGSLVLVVEDSISALKAISESLAAMEVPFVCMAQVEELDSTGITGWVPWDDEAPILVAWSDVSGLFCDYQILGRFTGADVVQKADMARVGLVIGMSSSRIFNQRMLLAGAIIAEPKPHIVRDIGAGRWKLK